MIDISVIVAIYNVAGQLDNCLQSLHNQEFGNTEFIIVDDGSNDGSSALCDKWATKDARFKVIHKRNGGLSDARNAGLDVAQGKYIMFVDGDDVLSRGTLQILYMLAMGSDASMIQYGYRETYCANLDDEVSAPNNTKFVENHHEMFEMLYQIGGEAASGCTKLITRHSLDELRFEKDRLHEDEIFVTRLLPKLKSILYLTGFTPYQYIKREGSIITGGFNSKRLNDICYMYEERIKILSTLGYDDLVEVTKCKYYSSLYLLYHKACTENQSQSLRYITQKLSAFPPFNSRRLSLEIRLAKHAPRLMMPILYELRRFINKPIK